jgi:hypothetical protein
VHEARRFSSSIFQSIKEINMSKKNHAKLVAILAVLTAAPGQHVWTICDMIGVRTGQRKVRGILRNAERRGEVVSIKEAGRRLYFVATESTKNAA